MRAAVISWDSTAARALQMAMTDWITRSAFSGNSPCGQGEAERSPGLRARAKQSLCPRGAGSKQGRGWGAAPAPSCAQEKTKERNKCCPQPSWQLPNPPRSCHVQAFPPFPPFPSSDADFEPHRDNKKVCSKCLLRSLGIWEPLLLGRCCPLGYRQPLGAQERDGTGWICAGTSGDARRNGEVGAPWGGEAAWSLYQENPAPWARGEGRRSQAVPKPASFQGGDEKGRAVPVPPGASPRHRSP